MTSQTEAQYIVERLSRAFPQAGWDGQMVQAWFEAVERVEYDAALAAADAVIGQEKALPGLDGYLRRVTVAQHKADTDSEEKHERSPQTPLEWERKAQEQRTWRAAEYPQTVDPAAGQPLPRSKKEYDLEWVAWWRIHFGWAPEIES